MQQLFTKKPCARINLPVTSVRISISDLLDPFLLGGIEFLVLSSAYCSLQPIATCCLKQVESAHHDENRPRHRRYRFTPDAGFLLKQLIMFKPAVCLDAKCEEFLS